MATDRVSWREPTQEVPSDTSASSSPRPSVQGEDDELALKTMKAWEGAINTKPAPSSPRGHSSRPSRVARLAQNDRFRIDLNFRIKNKLQARIPHAWFQSMSLTLKDTHMLLAAMRYLRWLRDHVSGTRRAPFSRAERWPLGRLLEELRTMIPERLQKEGQNIIDAQTKCTSSTHIMVAIDLYLDELEATVSGLGGDAVQSSEPDESDEWDGIADDDETEEDAAQQQGLHEKSDEAEEWHGVSASSGVMEEAVERWEPHERKCRTGIPDWNRVEEEADQRMGADQVENGNDISESGKAEEEALPATQLKEEEWTRIVEEIQEQSKNIEAFDEALARAEGRRVYIGNLARKATQADLEAFFSGYEIGSIRLRQSRRRPSYAFLEFKDGGQVTKAISELSGKELLGRTVRVKLASDDRSGPMAAREEREARAAARSDDAPTDKSRDTTATDQVRTVSEAQVENALLKMEQWCDLWLSGMIGENQWHTFEDCLGLNG